MSITPRPDAFKAVLDVLGGPALPCHYALVITPPAAIWTGSGLGGGGAILGPIIGLTGMVNLSFMAESCSIPGRQYRTTNHYTYGSYRRMPVGVDYPTFMATFICTTAMTERHFFDLWHQYIMASTSQYMGYYDDIIGEITVKKLTDSGIIANATSNTFPVTPNNALVELGSTAAWWTFTEAYPISIQAQELNSANGDYMRLTVEFSYKHWHNSFSPFINDSSGFE